MRTENVTSLWSNPKALSVISAVLAALILFAALGSLPLMSLNEGRRALVIKEMFFNHHWLLPTQNGALYLTKPPLFYWTSLIFSYLFDTVNEWTLRLPSATAAAACMVMVFRYTKRFFGDWAALFALQLLAVNVGFVLLARRAEIELLLATLCVGALLSAIHYIKLKQHDYWIYGSYFLLGLAVLTKGPVAMLFVTLPLLVSYACTREPLIKAILLNKTGWLIFILTASAWYVAVSAQLGWDVWGKIIQHDMVNKIESHEGAKPLLSYIGWIAVDFLLLVGLFLVKPMRLWHAYKHSLSFVLPLVAVLVAIVVFSAFSNKHAKYLLPIYPVIVILLSAQMATCYAAGGVVVKRLMVGAGLLLLSLFAVFYLFIEPKVFHYRIAAFQPFTQWSAQQTVKQLYAFDDVDSRLIYYAKKPVRLVNREQIERVINSQQSLIFLAEDQDRMHLLSLHGCELHTFKPYLKRNRQLVAIGFGKACALQP